MLPVSALEKDILRLEAVEVLECVLFSLMGSTVSGRIGSMESLAEHSRREKADFIVTLEENLPFIARGIQRREYEVRKNGYRHSFLYTPQLFKHKLVPRL